MFYRNTITGSNGLSKEDIDRMVREAEENKEADDKRKEEAELRNKAEQYINSIDQGLAEKGDSIDQNQKDQTIKLRDELKEALDKNDMDTLRSKISDLERAAEYMAQAQGNPSASQTTTNTSDNSNQNTEAKDDVIDADFTDKK